MKLIQTNEMHKTIDGKNYTLKEYRIGGYLVRKNVVEYNDGHVLTGFSVVPVSDERYLPDIYYHDDIFGKKKPCFKAQTTSYGALNADEYDKFVEGVLTAQQVLKILNETFIK